MDLKFTPRRVKEIEDRARRPLTDVISVFSVGNLALLVEKGCGLANEDLALEAIENEFENGGEMTELFLTIMERLQEGGFLPKALDLKQMRKQITDPALLKESIEKQNLAING